MLFVTSKDNSNVKKAVKLKSSAKERRKSGLFLAEGLRICMDAVFSGAEIQTLFVTEKAMQKHGEDFALLEEKAKNVICVNKCDGIGEPTPEFYEFYNTLNGKHR